MAYTSDDSKHGHEIYVQSFPAGLGRFQVSDNGGVQPRCRRDGTECSYVAADGKLMAVVVKTVPAFPAGIPHTLFDPRIVVSSFGTPFERNADAFYLKTNRRAGGRSSL